MLDRRQWLRVSLAAGAAAVVPGGLAGCDSPPAGRLAGGVATFEVSDTGALIAIYASAGGEVWVEVELGDGMLATPPIELDATTGNTGYVELVDLVPDTDYRYRVVTGAGAASEELSFRTAPAPDVAAEVRFAFSADIDVDPEFDSPIFESLVARAPAFFVSLGDWPYADNPPGAWTVPEFRARHREVRVAAKIARLLQRVPVYAIYDDHEVRNEWDGRFSVEERDRVLAGLQVWDEWFPLRERSDPAVRYRSWRWGALVELFLLDTRLYRSANEDEDGPDKTMLGADQKQWLKRGLTESTAPFKIVVTSVPLDFDEVDNTDGWGSFRTERDELVQHVIDNGVSGVVALSADRHWFAAHHHATGLKEFQVGPLARGLRELPPPAPGVVARASTFNFGELSVSADRLVFVARDADGAELYRETIAPGRGVLQVDSATAGRAFVAHGAHRFAGTTPAEFPYATPGEYTVSFDDGGPEVSGALVDGETLRLVG